MTLENALPDVECEVPIVGKQIWMCMGTTVDRAERNQRKYKHKCQWIPEIGIFFLNSNIIFPFNFGLVWWKGIDRIWGKFRATLSLQECPSGLRSQTQALACPSSGFLVGISLREFESRLLQNFFNQKKFYKQ